MFLDLLKYFKAGLLMLVRDFSLYVWEEEVQKLTLPHFFLGIRIIFTLVLKP